MHSRPSRHLGRQWFNNLSPVRVPVAREDEGNEDSSSDIPSFEDLVEEIKRQETGQVGAQEAADSAVSGADSKKSGTASDGDVWNWGGVESDDTVDTSRTDSSVDSLWEGSDSSPDSESVDQFDASKAEALIELIDDASNVLLVGPAGLPVEHDICSKLCDVDTNGKRRRLLITTEQSADERLDALRPYTDEPFDETTIIVVGDQVRSNDSSEPSAQQVGDETVVIEALHDPMDLTRLGVLINKYMGEGERPPVICFHTLNGILQFVGIEKMFRFLHILQARVRSVGGQAHYQIDPESVEDQAVSTLRSLFDFTIWYDEDGSISVEPRS